MNFSDFIAQYQILKEDAIRKSIEVTEDMCGIINYECYSSKDLYYCTYCSNCNMSQYSHMCYGLSDCFDCTVSLNCSQCYMIYSCSNSTNIHNCNFCHKSSNLDHCFYCKNCRNCFGCFGLLDQQFCIYNRKVSPSEYKFSVDLLKNMPEDNIQNEMHKIYEKLGILGKLDLGNDNENSVFTNEGHCLKDCYYCFGTVNSSDCMYAYDCQNCNTCVDATECMFCEDCYSIVKCYKCNNIHYSENSSLSRDSMFLLECQECSNCFGCVQLKNKEYCILNKQYSREEYLAIAQILKESINI